MIRDVMDAIAAALSGAPGVDQVTPRLNVKPTGLSIDVYPHDPEFVDLDVAGFGPRMPGYSFTVRARVATPDLDAAQDALLDLMDDTLDQSVGARLEDDQSLGGLASSVDVEGPTGFRRYVDVNGEAARLGCEWTVTILPLPS